VEERPCLGLGFEEVVHGELAADDIEDDLLFDVAHGLVRVKHMVDERVAVSCVCDDEYARELDAFDLAESFDGLVNEGLLVFESYVMRGFPVLVFVEPLAEVATLARAQIEYARQVLETQLVDVLVDQHRLDPVVELP
jgi:hypothetical protein